MDCPSCQAENRPGRRFCGKCGTALPVTCPSCGFANEPNDAFCGGCGTSLEAEPQAAAPKESEPNQAPKPAPAREPESDAVESARRHLTVLFCDMVGSTNLSERLDPEELTELLTAYRVACVEVVDRFDGHIGNFQGDGILIYFGYPHAHEDDPQRAIRAGLGMIAAVDQLNDRTGRPDLELAVRIGINSGVVVAGDIGAGEQRERMAIVGETPNVAARLQNLAGPGTVVIGSSTKRLVEGLFVCESMGPQRIKGITEPMETFQVREISDVRSRFEATLRRGLTPLVGRQEEIGVLLRRWDQAKDGEGQVVLISSEPGVGKSRILQNFQGQVEGGESKIVHYVCSTYHRDTPYHPLTDQLERTLGIGRDDTAEQMLDKLDGFLDELGLAVPRYGPMLAALLALPTSGRYETQALSPEDKKRRTLKALVAVAESLSSRAPLLDSSHLRLQSRFRGPLGRPSPYNCHPSQAAEPQGKPGSGGWRDRRQGASAGRAQSHSGPDRWGAAVHRRAHQDDPGNGGRGRARRSLRADRPPADHDHPGVAS
jgi:class 3 adenylate cyclase